MKKLMAANWKMYKTAAEARETAAALAVALDGKLSADREVLVFPPFTAIHAAAEAFAGKNGLSLGGQDVYPEDEGAFTGEISAPMLKDASCEFILTGHSERRHVMGEDNEFVGRKTAYAIASGMKVVLCIGEKIEEREAGSLEAVLEEQLVAGLAGVSRDVDPERVAVAYEPVWAIGTGKVAGPEDIVEAHAFTRAKLVEMFGEKGKEIRILYGGSVKPANASEIITLDNVDGVLVGGASLQADSFSSIVLA